MLPVKTHRFHPVFLSAARLGECPPRPTARSTQNRVQPGSISRLNFELSARQGCRQYRRPGPALTVAYPRSPAPTPGVTSEVPPHEFHRQCRGYSPGSGKPPRQCPAAKGVTSADTLVSVALTDAIPARPRLFCAPPIWGPHYRPAQRLSLAIRPKGHADGQDAPDDQPQRYGGFSSDSGVAQWSGAAYPILGEVDLLDNSRPGFDSPNLRNQTGMEYDSTELRRHHGRTEPYCTVVLPGLPGIVRFQSSQ